MQINTNDFSRIADYMRTWLTYSQIFGFRATRDEIIKDIQCININEAITILAKFSVLDNQSRKILINDLKPFINDKDILDSVEPFDLINLMYAIKWFIAYGCKEKKDSFKNNFPDSFNVFLIVLKISDYMVDSLDSRDEAEEQVLKSWLFNRPGEIDKALIRQYVMFEEIARNKDLFNKKDFVDIHTIFENEYGYSIKEYVATLFALQQPCIKELNLRDAFNQIEWGINIESFFETVKIKGSARKISDDLSTDIEELKEWAIESISNPFDNEFLLSKPMFKSGKYLIPFSPGLLNSTIFDGLCFKLNSCCNKAKKSFFSFFGRLFEQYVSETLYYATKNSKKIVYEFIDEFEFSKNNKKSSDAYLKLGRSLMIFECKGGRLRKETKILAQPEFSEEDHEKYALNPIEQANTAYEQILAENPEKFKRINKVYILSVSLQPFPKVPKYNELLNKFKNELHLHVKEVDYIGLSDLELLAYIINHHDFSLFRFIKNKKEKDEFIPYLNYYYRKYGEIKRTDKQNIVLNECFNEIRTTLF